MNVSLGWLNYHENIQMKANENEVMITMKIINNIKK